MSVMLSMNLDADLAGLLYGLLRMVLGFLCSSYSVAIVLAMELVGPTYRVAAGNLLYYFYILGEFINLALAYFLRDFRDFQIGITVVICTFCLYFWYALSFN